MTQTPGVILPSSYPSQEALRADLKRRDDEAGFTPFDPESLMHSSTVEDILEHHGVKGMKWGVRNKKNRVKTSRDFRDTAAFRNKKAHELTNKQLKDVNNRLNLEQNYNRLNPSTIKKGEAHAKGILSLVGTATAVVALINSPNGRELINKGRAALAKAFVKATKIRTL